MMKMIRAALAALLALAPAAAPAQTSDSSSSILQLLIMGQGLHANDWGVQTNSNIQKIENAIAAATPIVTSGGTMTLTDDQARSAVLSFSGTLVADVTVTVPARSKSWVVLNKTSGAYALKLKTASGTPVTVPQSSSQARLFYCDGASVFDVSSGGVPDLTSNTFLANTGSGPIAATYAQVLAALGLDNAGTPEFKGLKVSGAVAGDWLDVSAVDGAQILSTLRVKGPAASARTLQFQTDAAKRWTLAVRNNAESGSNAGSDLELNAYADNGTTVLGPYMSVTRSTGATSFPGAGGVSITGPLTAQGSPITPPVDGYARNLKITVTSDTAATVSADALTLWDGSTGTKTFRSLSLSVSTACSTGPACMDTGGPGTSRWLQVWAVGKADGTISATLTAAAAPTPPALATGYVYYARLGALRIDSSSRIVKSQQRGNVARYVVQGSGSTPTMPVLASGTAGAPATPTWATVAWSAVAPPTAASLQVIAASSGGSIMVAPNSSFGANNSTSNPPPCQSAVAGAFVRSFCDITLETSNVSWASDVASQAIFALGWTDLL